MAVIAGLLSGVVYAKPLLRPQTRLWPPAALFAGCARGHNLKQALPPEVLRDRADLERDPELAGRPAGRMALHRAGKTHAERVRGKLQWPPEGRVPERASL